MIKVIYNTNYVKINVDLTHNNFVVGPTGVSQTCHNY